MATFYRAQMFAECLGDGSEFGLEIAYIQEEAPLDTGGAIRNAASGLRSGPDDPVVVLNGDILSGHDLPGQVAAHVKAGAAVTLHLVEGRRSGEISAACRPDSDGRVTGLPGEDAASGDQQDQRRVLRLHPAGYRPDPPQAARYRSSGRLFPGLIGSGQLVLGHVDTSYWLDVGTPEAFIRGSRDLVLGELASPALPGPCGEALVLPGARRRAGCQGQRRHRRRRGDATSARDAQVDGSVLFDGAEVGPGAAVRSSVVGRAARIGEGAVLDAVVIGDGAPDRVRKRARPAGSGFWPGVELGPRPRSRFSTDA